MTKGQNLNVFSIGSEACKKACKNPQVFYMLNVFTTGSEACKKACKNPQVFHMLMPVIACEKFISKHVNCKN